MDRSRILVVDDESFVRRALSAVLTRAGYEVPVAEDGRAAIEYVQEHPVDAVLTDVIMPVASGLEVIRYLREKHPAVRVLAMSGHEVVRPALVAAVGAENVLMKPFASKDLLEALARIEVWPDCAPQP